LPAIRAQIERASAEARAHPQDAKAWGHLAMTLHAYQLYEPAAQAYLRASSVDARNFDWLYLLGAVQMTEGSFGAAVKSFQSALTIRQENLPARLRLAETLIARAAWDDAGTIYRQILDQHHDLPQAWYGLGRASVDDLVPRYCSGTDNSES
jgi:tetratricopeptide (TPR) repeat protein